jgi:glycosyltransferase involved in cell wall biosynthesis
MTRRIGVFCPTLNVYGGGEYVAIALANTLAHCGFDVVLFSSGKVDPSAIKNYFGETLNPHIQTLQQPTNFTPHGLGDFYQSILHSYIAKSKCSAFIDAFSNCIYPWTQISYIHFPCLNRHAYAKTFPYLHRPRISQACTAPYVTLEKNLIDYEKRLVLANSHYTAAEIQNYSHKTANVLYPPFSESIRAMGKTAKKPQQENLVVTVSRLDANKQLERIPQIAAQTPSDVQFAVVGRLLSKPTLTYLEELTKKMGLTDRVRFYPNASAEQKVDLLKRAKLYLHTMEGEHFGISIVEAMAMGCLPIVHDSGGMREFVPAQYRYSSLEGVAEKVSAELADWSPDRAEDMKAIASEFSFQKFSEHFMEYFNSYFSNA